MEVGEVLGEDLGEGLREEDLIEEDLREEDVGEVLGEEEELLKGRDILKEDNNKM